MANPYFVQPADHSQAWQGMREGYNEMQVKQRQQAAREAMKQAFGSGDPGAVRQAVIEYPEIAETASQLFGFTNDQTEQVARETYRRALTSNDPEQIRATLEGGIETVRQFGGNPRMMSSDLQTFMQDPEAGLRSMKAGFAAVASEPEYGSVFGSPGGDLPMSIKEWNEFQRMTPSQQEQYLIMKRGGRTVDYAGVPMAVDPYNRGIAPYQIAGQPVATQPEQAERIAEQEAAAAGAEEEARATARSQAETMSPEAVGKARKGLQTSQETLNIVNDLLGSDLGRVSGYMARTPTLREESRDMILKAQRLESLLTAGNLDLMSGVLSESDMKVIRDLSSGLQVTESGIGLSEEATRSRLRQIRERMEDAIRNQQAALSQAEGSRSPAAQGNGGGAGNEDIEALVNKYAE